MRKTILGTSILIVILSIILINNAFLGDALDDVRKHIDCARVWYYAGEIEWAAAEAANAVSVWKGKEAYLMCFMNHDEIQSAAETIAELQFALQGGGSADFESAYDEIEKLLLLEKISIESIL